MNSKDAAQIAALSAMVQALVVTHPDHERLRRELHSIRLAGFKGETDDMQNDIDLAILNWSNGMRVERRQD